MLSELFTDTTDSQRLPDNEINTPIKNTKFIKNNDYLITDRIGHSNSRTEFHNDLNVNKALN